MLSSLGLSKYKIETYMALVRLRKGSVGDIAKNSSVPTSKLYEVLKWLHEKGFITQISQRPLAFRANDPRTVLKDEVGKRKSELERIGEKLDALDMSFPVAEKDIIQITVTKDAYFKKIKESVINANRSIDYIAKNWRLDAELVRLLQEKSRNGVSIRALGPVNKGTNQKVMWLRKAGVKVKNLEPEDTHFAIYDDSMVVISLRSGNSKSDYSAVWIKSEVLARIMSKYFNALWGN